MTCETCNGKGYIYTRRHPDDKDHVERCDECFREGRVSWTDEQAAWYAQRRALRQAIRSTHYGTMGDPMNPRTR